MRIAVTGADGRMGRPFVAFAQARGHEVVALDRRPPAHGWPPAVAGHVVDLTDHAALRTVVDGCDALVHLGALTNPGAAPEPEVHHNNVVSSYNALSAASAAGIERICLASSVNAIGGVFSSAPRFDYFPLDEEHPGRPEDPYSLSKWVAEQQAAAFARRFPTLAVTCLRMHALRERDEMAARFGADLDRVRLDLWGYTPMQLALDATLGALAREDAGLEVCYVVADDTYADLESEQLRRRYYPEIPVKGDLSGHRSFFDSSRAGRLVGTTAGGTWTAAR